MTNPPTQDDLAGAVEAGKVFNSRAELIQYANQCEGYDLDFYHGRMAFWNGKEVGGVATEAFSRALYQALEVEGQCSQRADRIMLDGGAREEETQHVDPST